MEEEDRKRNGQGGDVWGVGNSGTKKIEISRDPESSIPQTGAEGLQVISGKRRTNQIWSCYR